MGRKDEEISTDETKVTPAMIEAGVAEFDLIDFESANEGADTWVVDIYRAMEAVRAKMELETPDQHALP